MYSRSDNLQAMGSRQQIRDALLSLTEREPYQDISIAEICRQANVVRQTFYRNFELKEDILAYHMDSLFEEYFATLYEAGEEPLAQLGAFYRFMQQNQPFLRMVQENELFHFIDRSIGKNLPRFVGIGQIANVEDEKSEPYMMSFIAATLCALLAQWVRNGFAQSPDWMAKLTDRLWMGLHYRTAMKSE